MKQFKSILTAMLLLSTVVFIGCSDDDETNPISNNNNQPTLDIVETAAANGNFTTLLAAAEAAGLVEALKAEGPLTVFAPTDSAFAALPAGTVEALLADTDALTAILTYHVTVGAIKAAEVVTKATIPTLNGAELSVTVNGDGTVMIDDAMVVLTDIETSNGIIHVIDAVVIPQASASAVKDGSTTYATGYWFGSYRFGGGWISQAIVDGRLNWLTRWLSIYDVARLAGLNTLTTAVKAADLKSTLKYNGPFTVFAPTEDAFGALPEGTIPALLNDIPTLQNILLYHVTAGRVTSDIVVTLDSAPMVNGGSVSVAVVNGGVVLNNDVNVVAVDIKARNGVIHVIDKVLLP